MIDRLAWPAIETLLRLLLEGKVRRSGARQAELDRLEAMRWVTLRKNLAVPESARVGDLGQRLTSLWPDWKAKVETAREADLNLFDPLSYAPGRRTLEVALGLDPDPISIELIREILTRISGDRASLDIRVRTFRGRTAIVDIVDGTAQSAADFEREVQALKSKLLTALSQLHEKEALIERLKDQIKEVAAQVYLAGTAYQEMHAAIIAITMPGFDHWTAAEREEAVSLLGRMLDHSPGRDAIAWRENRAGAWLFIVRNPLDSLISIFRLVRHMALEQFEVRCALAYGLVTFTPSALGGGRQASGRPVEEVATLLRRETRDGDGHVVATGEFRDTLFDGAEQFLFAALSLEGGVPISGGFAVRTVRN